MSVMPMNRPVSTTPMVAEGPAVDGVSLRREAAIDSLGLDVHHRKLMAIRAVIAAPSRA